ACAWTGGGRLKSLQHQLRDVLVNTLRYEFSQSETAVGRLLSSGSKGREARLNDVHPNLSAKSIHWVSVSRSTGSKYGQGRRPANAFRRHRPSLLHIARSAANLPHRLKKIFSGCRAIAGRGLNSS